MYKTRLQIIEKAIKRSRFQSELRNFAKISPKSWSNYCIVISRDPGSGGRLVAKRLARKLGWKFYDKKILQKLAMKLNIPQNVAKAIDEHPRTAITDIFQSLFNPDYISDFTYIKFLKKIIINAGQSNKAVFLGRGANHIIPHKHALCVRITAPFDNRVKNTIKHEHLSKRKAIERVKKVEKNRNEFIKQYFGVEPGSPNNFDITINTERIPLNTAVDIIISTFKKKFPKTKL